MRIKLIALILILAAAPGLAATWKLNEKTEKMILDDADILPIEDSLASWAIKKVSYATLKTNLQSVFYTESEVDAALALKANSADLGTAATRAAEDTLTNGSNLPDGAAIITYGDANWGGGTFNPDGDIAFTGDNTHSGTETFSGGTVLNGAISGDKVGTDTGDLVQLVDDGGSPSLPFALDLWALSGLGTEPSSDVLLWYNSSTGDMETVTIGSGVTFSNGTLSASGGSAEPTFQDADPTTNSPTGVYGANTSGKVFLVENGVAIWEVAATRTAATPVVYPTFTAAEIGSNGTDFNLTASEAVTAGAGGTGGIDVDCATAGALTATYSSGDATASLVYTLSATVNSTDTCTYDYTQPGDGWEDGDGDELASFTLESVTNSSTQGGGQTTLMTETFDTVAGYDNSWVEPNGTPDEDYSTSPAPLEGTQSLYLGARANAANQETYYGSLNPSAGTTVVAKYMLHCTDLPTESGTANKLSMFEVYSAEVGKVNIVHDGTSVKLQTISQGTTGTNTVNAISEDTTYYVWQTYKYGTGSNAIATVAFNTVDSRPTSGDSYAERTDGTDDAEVTKLTLGGSTNYISATVSYNCIIDDLEVWEE